MKKLIILMTVFLSISSFANTRTENIMRWEKMLSNNEITQTGYNLLVDSLDRPVKERIVVTLDELREIIKGELLSGDLPESSYIKMMKKIKTVKQMQIGIY